MAREIEGKNKVGAVLVAGAGIGGMQAAIDLGNAGYKVYLVEEKSAIGGRMAQLDKTFPTNDCSMCTISPRLVEVDKHPNVEILTNSEILGVDGEAGRFQARILKHPRYVDMEKCNACGDCFEVCPVEVPNEFDANLRPRKAIHKLYPQAIPNKAVIQKAGVSPCKAACPAHIHVQGYLALARKGKYKEAVNLIRKDCALPSVCGRVCVRFCEEKCTRARVDEPIAINDVKWFLSEQETDADLPEIAPAQNRKVGVIGAGPGGLSCAHQLALQGYSVTVFEKDEQPGGVLRYGIPEYRLPKAVLDRDIDYVKRCGVEIRCSTALGQDFTLESLRNQGYEAIFLGVGCSTGASLGIDAENTPGVIQGVDFLKAAARSEKVELGKKTLVIGGGNVAVDVARTAVRLGVEEVHMVCLEDRDEMPAHVEEIHEAEAEGVIIHNCWGPFEFVPQESGAGIKGVCFNKCVCVFDEHGKFNPSFDDQCSMGVAADTVILAIGQRVDAGLAESLGSIEKLRGNYIVVDPITYSTSVEGVFAAGDVVTGPKTVIQAIAGGKEAAESIRRYLEGEDLKEGRDVERPIADPDIEGVSTAARERKKEVPAKQRKNDFRETVIGLDESAVKAETERCLSCGVCSECLECVRVCPPKAPRHDELPEEVTLDVGSVILIPGFDTFQAHIKGEYGYGRMPNVLTSMEFERLLSASGPTEGEVRRPSDGIHPEKVAWIQCVGSRDVTCNRDYCSSVCCMYATKEAIIAREHDARIKPTIFYNDIRAFGKGFEFYYENAASKGGVRYIKGIVSTVKEEQQTKNLMLTFRGDDGTMTSETFDMVVLSVGLEPSASTRKLGERCGIDLNRFGFAETGEFSPNQTSREGIFVAGAFEAPMDIPESVMGAASAAALSGELLSEVRKTLIKQKTFAEERDIRGEEPRIGVFVCHCGSNIARIVNVPEVAEYALTLPHVVHAEHNLFTCSTDTTVAIAEKIREKGINRLVVASCSPRTHEPLFRDVCREAGINKYLFEMANIRDQCSWVHQQEPEPATIKAKDLIRMAVSRAARLEPIQEHTFPVVPSGLVIGGGVGGMTAALSLADQGFECALVEREDRLGGAALNLRRTLGGLDVAAFVDELQRKVFSHPKIKVLLNSELTDYSGHVGRFSVRVRNRQGGEESEIESGAIVVATGGREYEPTEYLRGQSDKVWTQTELDRYLHDEPSRLEGIKNVVMIQCVGSREPDNLYCSRVCCGSAIKNALALKKQDPSINVFVLYRDIRTYGFKELYYRKAREAGVIFLRYDTERKPTVEEDARGLKVTVFDEVLRGEVELPADRVVLSAAIRPHSETEALGTLMKIPRNDVGFFMEAHMKMRPLDFASEGIYLCGLAHGPKYISETLAQAKGAAARAATVLSKEFLQVSGEVSVVDPDLCASCLTCVRVCPFNVPAIDPATNRAYIETASCQGCGICASVCPRKAIRLQHHTDEQVLAKVQAV
ncbi:MAG TPA: FAD-dependent oxidoreductase [Desulfomonilaceae bacterium]|nr:FAD-dependent oxidoreductase [Desulfomonilaceae bacterium]